MWSAKIKYNEEVNILKTKLLFIILVLILTAGCSKMLIIQDGLPVPDHSFSASNAETSIRVEVTASRWHYIDEEGEKVLWPEYLTLGKKHYMNADNTEYVRMDIVVRNPNKARYQIIRYTTVNGQDSKKIMYEGRLRYKHFIIGRYVEEATLYTESIMLNYGDGFPMIHMGDLIYKVRKPIENERGGDAG